MSWKKRSPFALILAAGLLAGCAAPAATEPKQAEPESVTVWHYYNGPQKETFDQLVQEFNETVGREKRIVVEAVSKGTLSGLIEAVSESAAEQIGSSKLPQLSTAYSGTALELDQQGLLADIGPYLTEEERAAYVDAYLEEGCFSDDGSLKIFPTAKSTEVLTLNLTDWEPFAQATGSSLQELATWEGIARTAERYYQWTDAQTPALEDGHAFFGRDAMANYMLAGSSQLGCEILQVRDGRALLNFDEAAMRQLWDAYYLPYVKGHYTAQGKFRSDDMTLGNLIAYVGATSGAPYTPEKVVYEDGSSKDITCAVLPAPNFEGTEPVAVQQGAGMVLFQGEERTERAAVEFLKWFTQAETNLRFCAGSGYLPVRKDANDPELLERISAELELSASLRQSLLAGVEQVSQSRLYIMDPFASGNDARNVLSDTIAAYADADRQTVEAMIGEGLTTEEAVEALDPEQRFSQWYQETYEKLTELTA